MAEAPALGEMHAASLVDTAVTNRGAQVLLIRVAIMLGLLSIWQLSSGRIIDDFWLSRPSAVALRLYEWTIDATLPYHTWITLQEMVLGFLIGSVTGIVAGIGLGLSRSLGDIVNPFIVALYKWTRSPD